MNVSKYNEKLNDSIRTVMMEVAEELCKELCSKFEGIANINIQPVFSKNISCVLSDIENKDSITIDIMLSKDTHNLYFNYMEKYGNYCKTSEKIISYITEHIEEGYFKNFKIKKDLL